LAGELLKKAEALLEQKVHPTVIVQGYRMAAEKAIEILKATSLDVSMKDKDLLQKIAETAMTGKLATPQTTRSPSLRWTWHSMQLRTTTEKLSLTWTR